MATNKATDDVKATPATDIEALKKEWDAEREKLMHELEATRKQAESLKQSIRMSELKNYTGKIDPNQMVTIRLTMDRNDRGPLPVRVNDYYELIPRGIDYDVPYYVALHIAEMEAQNEETLLLTMRMQDAFIQKATANDVGKVIG